MNLKKILFPAAGLAAALALTGCVTPYASGTVGSRIGNGGYVSGTIGAQYPYGYSRYGQTARVYGYDRYGNPLYRLPDGRVVQGYDPYRGGYSYPGYGYGYGYPGGYYGHPGYGYSYPYPPVYRPGVRPPRGHDGGGSTPVRPPVVRPVPTPDTRGGSPLGNVVRGVRQAERQRDTTPVRRSTPAIQEQ